MNAIKNTLVLLENYNALIKYHIKAYKEGLSDERRINFDLKNIHDIESFRTNLFYFLEQGECSEDLINLINRLFLLGESNFNLSVNYTEVEKHIYKIYPFAKEMKRLSFGIYDFIGNEVFCNRLWESEKSSLPKMTEFIFKENESMLWQTYYLLQKAVNACLIQEMQEMEHQLMFKSDSDKEKVILQQKEKRAEDIITRLNGFCDKDLPFMYVRKNPIISKNYLFYLLLSDIVKKLSLEEYAKYARFDYSKCEMKDYQWAFGRFALDDSSALQSLSGFVNLVRILTNAIFIKDFTKETENELGTIEQIENWQELDEYLDRKDKELDE